MDKEENKNIAEQIDVILNKMDLVEKSLYQTNNRSNQYPLNFPIRQNIKLAAVAGIVASSNNRPTEKSIIVKNELTQKINRELDKFEKIRNQDIPRLNELIWTAKIPAIQLKTRIMFIQNYTTIIRQNCVYSVVL